MKTANCSREESLARINSHIRETLDNFYKNHDADSFFEIVGIYNMCRDHELTQDEIPALIEMQNVIVMG